MTYTAKELLKIKDENTTLATAAADALELMEYSEKGEKGEPLDLSMETYDFVAIPLMMSGVALRRAKRDTALIRTELARKAASYDLFALCNLINSTGELRCKIDFNLPRSDRPLLYVTGNNDAGFWFDPYEVYARTKEDCFLFPAEGVAVDLGPVRERIQLELFEQL